MDINHPHKLTSSPWEVSMAMENHIMDDHIPLESFWPNLAAFENHQVPSSSCQIPDVTGHVLRDQIVNQQMEEEEEEEEEELGAMKEMMFKIAAMQPVDIDPATIRKPKRRNVRISDDPQSVAARHRRERISEKIRILQRLVPGGTKMDTASMLDEAIRYVKFLKRQIRQLQANEPPSLVGSTCPPPASWTIAKGLSSSTTTATAVTTYNVRDNGFGSDQPMCFDNEVIRE